MGGARTQKDRLEEALFARRRDLFNQPLQLVFFDTTSIYVEGSGGETVGRHGHSKDHRPDVRQRVVGLVLDLDGRPVCSELWPGNTTPAARDVALAYQQLWPWNRASGR